MCRTHFQTFLPNLSRLSELNGQTQMVGLEAQGATYSTGYHRTLAQASIHLLSSQSLPHPLFDQFLFNLRTLFLEPLGTKFRLLHNPSLSLFTILCSFFAVLIAFMYLRCLLFFWLSICHLWSFRMSLLQYCFQSHPYMAGLFPPLLCKTLQHDLEYSI